MYLIRGNSGRPVKRCMVFRRFPMCHDGTSPTVLRQIDDEMCFSYRNNLLIGVSTAVKTFATSGELLGHGGSESWLLRDGFPCGLVQQSISEQCALFTVQYAEPGTAPASILDRPTSTCRDNRCPVVGLTFRGTLWSSSEDHLLVESSCTTGTSVGTSEARRL